MVKIKDKIIDKPANLATMIEQQFQHFDTRVVTRKRDCALYELAATEEHIIGLRAGLAEQTKSLERQKARVAGLTAVLAKRGA